jgi:hopanoid biosynthesis associated protein HpnK
MGCRLIVHADDFGLSEKINTGIIDAYVNGILRSTSIVASGQAFDHAVALVRSNSSLDIGIHLTLVEEQPISAPQQIPTLVNSKGQFLEHATIFTKQYLRGKINKQDIRRELGLQIEKILATGLTVSHLDSHQHVHMLPGIWGIVYELSKKYQIPAIRYPLERFRGYMYKDQNRARLIEQFALNFFCTFINRNNIHTTDHFVGFFFGGHVNRDNLYTIIKNLPASGTCELMCHPGEHDTASLYNHWQYHWQDELDALKDGTLQELLIQQNIDLINWGQV